MDCPLSLEAGNVAFTCRHLRNTLNYTDWNDVDEDMVTISNQGGYYSDGESVVGIVRRNVNYNLTGVGDIVASLKNKD